MTINLVQPLNADWFANGICVGESKSYRFRDFVPHVDPTCATGPVTESKLQLDCTTLTDSAPVLRDLPECFYVVEGADWADFTISWTEIMGVPSKPMSIAKIIDAAMTRDFIERGPAPKVEPLPTFTPKRAKPAMAGLMCEHDGKVGGVGFCAG